MNQEGSNFTVRDTLRSIPEFRELITDLRETEAIYGPQIQSLYSSGTDKYVRTLVCDYTSKTELVYLTFLTYYLNTTMLKHSCPILLVELLAQLPEKIGKSTFLAKQEKIELWKLLTRQPAYLDNLWPFPYRMVRGILSDKEVIKKVRRRLYQKPRRPRSKVRRTQRHRGYRDHGNLRPSHCWQPKVDFSLTELQNEIERERDVLKRAYHLAITGKEPFDYSDSPPKLQFMNPPIDSRLYDVEENS